MAITITGNTFGFLLIANSKRPQRNKTIKGYKNEGLIGKTTPPICGKLMQSKRVAIMLNRNPKYFFTMKNDPSNDPIFSNKFKMNTDS